MKKAISKEKIFNYTIFFIFLFLFIFFAAVLGTWKFSRTFTADKWLGDINNRYRIVGNMLSKYEIVGMSEKEITDLLGAETENAPERFKYPRGEFINENTLTYYLGVDFMDDNWLIITIKDGKAQSYAIGVT